MGDAFYGKKIAILRKFSTSGSDPNSYSQLKINNWTDENVKYWNKKKLLNELNCLYYNIYVDLSMPVHHLDFADVFGIYFFLFFLSNFFFLPFHSAALLIMSISFYLVKRQSIRA